MGTLVDEIHNQIEAVIYAIAEAKLIINRINLVATQDANSPTTSLLSPASTTVSILSVDSIYKIPADIQKFEYLKSCLSGPAAEKVRVLKITADNYLSALKTLVDCYDTYLILINKHVLAILEEPLINNESPSSLIAAFNALNATYRALVATKKKSLSISLLSPYIFPEWIQQHIFNGNNVVSEMLYRRWTSLWLAHVFRKAAAEKCKDRPCELLHVKEAVAEGATEFCTNIQASHGSTNIYFEIASRKLR
ncbi:hypothetical protein M0804_013422 [Polistes exclamans]|nr:hypothetical protein M0804_013422 [Polistes exclamans]